MDCFGSPTTKSFPLSAASPPRIAAMMAAWAGSVSWNSSTRTNSNLLRKCASTISSRSRKRRRVKRIRSEKSSAPRLAFAASTASAKTAKTVPRLWRKSSVARVKASSGSMESPRVPARGLVRVERVR